MYVEYALHTTSPQCVCKVYLPAGYLPCNISSADIIKSFPPIMASHCVINHLKCLVKPHSAPASQIRARCSGWKTSLTDVKRVFLNLFHGWKALATVFFSLSRVQFVVFCFTLGDGSAAEKKDSLGRGPLEEEEVEVRKAWKWWKPVVSLTSSSCPCFDSWHAKLHIMKKL